MIRAAVTAVNGVTVIVRPAMVRVAADGTIMRLVGWKTRERFNRYDIHDDQDLDDGVAKLAKATGGAEFPR